MVHVVFYPVKNYEGDESLLFLVFHRFIVNAIFLKYSKEGRLSLIHVGIPNIPSDICYDYTKHSRAQSEHRHTQNPFQASNMECFCINSQHR